MLHSPTMPSARYSSWHFFFHLSTGHKTARTHIHPHVVGCELEYASKPYFWHDISRQMSLMHYIPTFPMWWLRRSGVVVCAKRASDLIFRLKLVSPDSFCYYCNSSHPLRKMQNSTYYLQAYRRYQAAAFSDLSSPAFKAAKKKIVDESRRYPRQVSLFLFLVGELFRRERSMHVGCRSKVSCTRAARRAITWARPRPSSLSGRTLPWKLGESCVPDKAPSRTAFYRLRGCTFYYY